MQLRILKHLIIFLLLPIKIFAQSHTEDLDGETNNATTFSYSSLTFNIAGQLHVENFSSYGVTGDDYYIDNSNNCSSSGYNGSIYTSGRTGIYIDSLYLFPSSNCGSSRSTGTITLTGYRNGSLVGTSVNALNAFVVVTSHNNGWSKVTTPFSTNLIDSIVITNSSPLNYSAIDHISFRTSSNTFFWWGISSSSPSITGNWSTYSVPSSTNDVVIKSSAANSLNLNSGSLSCADMTIESGASITVGSSATLNIHGDMTNSGSGFGSSTGTINFAKSGTSSLSGNAIEIEGSVTVASGCTLSTGGLLTLKSNATNTGRVGNSAGTISGDVTVQRYIPGKRAFRFLGHPFTTSQALSTITDDIDITGTGGTVNGFTTTNTNNASAYWFDITAANSTTAGNNPGWTAFTHTNGVGANSWDKAELIRLLGRGAKSEGLTSASYTPSAVTLDMTGTVNTGTQVITLTKGSSSIFVSCSNPFPSPVQMNTVAKGANIGANYYVWDATSGAKGAYVTNAFTTSYILPIGGALFTIASANSSNTLTFEESDKSDNTPVGLFKTTGVNDWVELLISDSTLKWDRLLINFNDNSMNIKDKLDAVKLYNPGLDFFTLSKDGERLAIDVRPYTDKSSIPIGLTAYNRYNKYVIRTGDYNVLAGVKLILHDKYLNTQQELKTGFEYWFDVTTDTLSQGNNRFEIYMQVKPTSVVTTDTTTPKIQLIPNPAQSQVKVFFDKLGGIAQIKLANVTGQVIYASEVNATTGSVMIPLTNMPIGMYIVTVQSKNARFTEKLIKQ